MSKSLADKGARKRNWRRSPLVGWVGGGGHERHFVIETKEEMVSTPALQRNHRSCRLRGDLWVEFNSKVLTQLVGLQPWSLHSRPPRKDAVDASEARGTGRGWQGTRN